MITKNITWFLAALFVLALGCGGGGGGTGGGGSSTGGTAGTPAPGVYIEFINAGGAWMDPLNLHTADVGTAVIVSYNSLGGRTPLLATAWETTAPGNVPIILSGLFLVNSSPGAEFLFRGTTPIATVPTVFEQPAAVPSGAATINGRVVELGLFTSLPTGTGVPHVRVDFFNLAGTKVASARTLQDGRFSAISPTTARYMMVEGNSVTARFNRSVYYQGSFYSPADTSCRISIGAIPAGITNLSASMALHLAAAGPPPPPSGCN